MDDGVGDPEGDAGVEVGAGVKVGRAAAVGGRFAVGARVLGAPSSVANTAGIIGAAPVSEHTALYREAIRLIAAIQRRGRELASDQYIPYGIAFDVAKLTWELEFFLKHFVVGYRGAEITRPIAVV